MIFFLRITTKLQDQTRILQTLCTSMLYLTKLIPLWLRNKTCQTCHQSEISFLFSPKCPILRLRKPNILKITQQVVRLIPMRPLIQHQTSRFSLKDHRPPETTQWSIMIKESRLLSLEFKTCRERMWSLTPWVSVMESCLLKLVKEALNKDKMIKF